MTAKLEDELAWLHEWTQRIDDRVKKLEEHVIGLEKLARTPSPTQCGWIAVGENELARLLRIERLARTTFQVVDNCGCRDLSVHGDDLREALKR